ncbi:hypothetical protein [Plantactinospora soyae]|uniref:Serine/threonine protein kinase n=1 Tax=Plantactinospora soyae TaxID=1544732 RepID=A0A927R023_9ACTN|nr:hypothetical protein [Plantactinospora soyae]MBE1491070.1 hypothetical protein [Plantactinospora soyae]
MTRALRATATALLLTLTGLAFIAAPASAAACDTRSSGTARGGYYVTIYCSGPGFIDGYGSTLTAANTNALLLNQLYVNYGNSCDGRSTSTTTGGYAVTIHCSGGGFIVGFGSILTDAAENARLLADTRGRTGNTCDGRSTSTTTGGYAVTIHCSGGGFIVGFGSTLTDAAEEARQLVLLRAATGNTCDGRSTYTVSGGYGVTLHCTSGGFVDGVGSTLTGAAVNARLAAG